jgi:plastocyanin
MSDERRIHDGSRRCGSGATLLVVCLLSSATTPAAEFPDTDGQLIGGETRGAQLHEVTVGNNFFSPANLTIEVGDFVRWTNLSGFHNIFSCNSGQIGCAGQDSTEDFDSGAPTVGPWVYTYQFQLPGQNPYVCQPHATTMAGSITVNVAPASPPVVPDGAVGTPVLVSKLNPQATSLSIAWDTDSCGGAADHHILFGVGSRLPGTPGGLYFLRGGECSLGLISPHVWTDVLDPITDTSRLLWYLVVADDGVMTEGSWGEDSTGNERSTFGDPGASGHCEMTDKDLSNTCGAD